MAWHAAPFGDLCRPQRAGQRRGLQLPPFDFLLLTLLDTSCPCLQHLLCVAPCSVARLLALSLALLSCSVGRRPQPSQRAPRAPAPPRPPCTFPCSGSSLLSHARPVLLCIPVALQSIVFRLRSAVWCTLIHRCACQFMGKRQAQSTPSRGGSVRVLCVPAPDPPPAQRLAEPHPQHVCSAGGHCSNQDGASCSKGPGLPTEDAAT